MVPLQASPPWVKRTQTKSLRPEHRPQLKAAPGGTWGPSPGGVPLGQEGMHGPGDVGLVGWLREEDQQPKLTQHSEQRGRLSCCLARSSCHSHSHQRDSSCCEGLPPPLAPSPPPWGWGCPLLAALGEGQTFSTHNQRTHRYEQRSRLSIHF